MVSLQRGTLDTATFTHRKYGPMMRMGGESEPCAAHTYSGQWL
jgi:hypothetical protein